MNSCEFITFVSSISCMIAKCSTPEEIELLSAVFGQLASNLATYAIYQNRCNPNAEDEDVELILR